MSRPNAIKEAKTYAKTVATFMKDHPLEQLLEDAVLSGFKICKLKYGIEDDIFERQMANQPTLFEWAKDNQNLQGGAVGA